MFFWSSLWSSQNVFGPPTAGSVVVDFKDRASPPHHWGRGGHFKGSGREPRMVFTGKSTQTVAFITGEVVNQYLSERVGRSLSHQCKRRRSKGSSCAADAAPGDVAADIETHICGE